MSDVIYKDVMQLNASVEQVRSFILNAERVAEYFPNLIEFGELPAEDGGTANWFRDKSAVSLLEYPRDQCTDTKVVMHVTSSRKAKLPFSIESLKADPLMSLKEDWLLEPSNGGTQLTKIWYGEAMHKMKWLPIRFIIRRTAKSERGALITAWNRAARLT